MSYEVILYYKFAAIENPEIFCRGHKAFLQELGVKGRVYIGSEGLNGTIGGTPEQMEKYRQYVWSLEGFEDTEFKAEESDVIPFPRLTCKVREEIVSIHMDGLDPEDGGRHMSPSEWREMMESGEDYVMIDVRNDYESEVGHFEGAIKPQVENFYDFPQWLDEAGIPKEKKVLMYCTGGIRCEKFSVLMKKKGWDDVNQLHGGILNYAKEEGGKHFKGKCFVFDDRLVVPVNKGDLQPIARCEITGKPADSFINCANMECNKLFYLLRRRGRRLPGMLQ
jgi:UPF0176 protein